MTSSEHEKWSGSGRDVAIRVSARVSIVPNVAATLNGAIAFAGLLGFLVMTGLAHAADPASRGEALYQQNCAACHGTDGRGEPGRQMLEVAPPDFTDCSFNSREPDSDFLAVIKEGGPARGFSEIMPAHGDVMSDVEIVDVLVYLRQFCRETRWPRGELNLRRPLITEKAFPEDEAVVTMRVDPDKPGFVLFDLLFEKRFGVRSQWEVELPVGFRENAMGDWDFGIGDLGVGVKHAFWHNFDKGRIMSVGGELKLPTGSASKGFSKDTVVIEPYLAYGQFLPRDWFLHSQLLAEFPTDSSKANDEYQLRAVIGKSIVQGSFGRMWSPMIEVIGKAEDAPGGTETFLDLVPQFQVTFNARQHVMFNLGARIPASNTQGRSTVYMAYLLWDWFDGGLGAGW